MEAHPSLCCVDTRTIIKFTKTNGPAFTSYLPRLVFCIKCFSAQFLLWTLPNSVFSPGRTLGGRTKVGAGGENHLLTERKKLLNLLKFLFGAIDSAAYHLVLCILPEDFPHGPL